jgi:predicted SAM-dependent methyltransferase
MPLKDLVRAALPAELQGQAPLRSALHEARREAAIARASRKGAKRLLALSDGATDLRVHLGAGTDVRDGWVNIDLPPGLPGVIGHDLRTGLPMKDGSAAFIYSSHFLEHLRYGDAIRLLADCHRVLRPSGSFRACLPDFSACFERYVAGDDEFFSLLPMDSADRLVTADTATRIDWMNRVVHENGAHHYCWDAEKIAVVLVHLGFRDVHETTISPLDPSDPQRVRYSFYVDATA